MFGFFMVIATAIKSFRDKVVESNVEYNKKKRELMRHIQNENRQDDAPIADDGEDLKKQTASEKLKTKLLAVLSTVVLFFELLPLFSSLMIWGLLVFCFLVVVVVIFTFLAMIQAFLKDQKNYVPEGMCGKPTTQVQESAGGVLAWTDEELASKGAKLTDREKNIYKMGVLARESIVGYGGKKAMNIPEASLATKVNFLLGVSSVESSMIIYSGGEKDVYKNPSSIVPNSAGYGFLGLNSSHTLETYYSNSVASKIREKFKPASRPSYEGQYPPYGMFMSAMHHQWKLDENVNRKKSMISDFADKNGIKANKKEFVGTVALFLVQAQYHGAVYTDYPGYIGFWGTMFLESAPDDASRSFSNWGLEDTKITDYSESGLRETYLGASGMNGMHTVGTPDKLKRGGSTKITLNGKTINDTLWGYLWKQSKGSKNMQTAWNLATSYSSSGSARTLNFHYGVNSYLQALRIEKNLSKKMGIVGDTGSSSSSDDSSDSSSDSSSDTSSTPEPSTSGSSEDCKDKGGDDDTPPTIQIGNFKETPGRGQSIVKGKPFDTWVKGAISSGVIPSSYYNKMKPTIGTSSQLAGRHARAIQAKYQDKVFGVPHYGQGGSYRESYGQLNWHYAGGDTFNWSGCMVYSHAYAASALTGRLINPAEMGIIMSATGGLGASGTKRSGVLGAHKALGLKAVYFGSGPYALIKAKNAKAGTGSIPAVLKKGGVVIIRVTYGTLTKISNHFFVLTSVETKNGVDYYSNYNSVDVGMSMRKLTQNDLINGRLHDEAVGVYK